jgi:hypothetical protein
MIELTSEKDVYEISVSAVIGVTRTIRVMAHGDMHARQVAAQKVKDDQDTHDWLFPPSGQMVNVPPDKIVDVVTGMSPKKIEADARDKKGTALFIGDDIKYVRSGKVRTATINDVCDGQKLLWCDESLFSITADEVTKA